MMQVDYRCQHNTLPKLSTADGKRGSKNTHCPATLSITLYKTEMPRKGCLQPVSNYIKHFGRAIAPRGMALGCLASDDGRLEQLYQRRLGGGHAATVMEIDESYFYTRKYHHSRIVNGLWVFGAVARESGR